MIMHDDILSIAKFSHTDLTDKVMLWRPDSALIYTKVIQESDGFIKGVRGNCVNLQSDSLCEVL